jgi:penicillin V acylase-like amidase (Ntn superfamily)
MFYLTQFAIFNEQMKTIEEVIPRVSGLLSTVFIPRGAAPERPDGGSSEMIGGEFTQYTVMKVPQQKSFYYKDYYNHHCRKLDLTTMDLTKPAYRLLADGTFGINDEIKSFFD